MNPILKRIITALATAGVVVGIILWAKFAWVLPVLIALIALVQLEFAQMVARKYEIMVWPGVIAGVLQLVAVFYFQDSLILELFFALSLLALFGKSSRPVEALATTALGFLYVPFMLRHLVDVASGGMMMLLYVVALVKFSDMGGFAIGLGSKKLFGDNHRMCPTVSPNKSWEGMGGSVVAAVLMSLCFMPVTHFSWPKALVLGVAAAVVGTLGDLVESRFKRDCGVKDSATFMPAGLGGFLDMFDSLLFAPAVLLPFI